MMDRSAAQGWSFVGSSGREYMGRGSVYQNSSGRGGGGSSSGSGSSSGGNSSGQVNSSGQQSNGGDDSWTDFGKGIRGPVLVASGSDIIPKNSKLAKSIWNESRWIKGSNPNTSLPSLASRRFLNGKTPVSWLPKSISLGGQIGRLISRANIVLGVILTGYDLYTDYKLSQEDPVEFWRKARQDVTSIGMYHNQ